MTIATKTDLTYKELMTLLNACSQGDTINIEYNTVRNFNLDNEIDNLVDKIKEMPVNEIFKEDNLKSTIKNFFENNIHGEKKNEIYSIRKVNDEIESNDAGFLLFDSLNGIKSVYVRNIISVTIDSIKYYRK